MPARGSGWLLAIALSLVLGAVAPVSAPQAGPRDVLEELIRKKARKAGVEKPGAATEPGAAQADGMSLDDAVKAVRRRHPRAEVVGAQTRTTDSGRLVHEVKILKQNGQVKTYRFDVATGDNLD